MSDHAKPVNDRVDFGHRLFLTGFFLPLALASSSATIGYGLTRNWWIPLAGLANVLALVFAANVLYQGNRTAEKVVKLAGVVLFIAALVVFIVGQSLVACFLGAQLLMLVILAAAITPPSARAFFAYQRHEFVEMPIEAPQEELPVESILVDGVLPESAKGSVVMYSRLLRLTGVVLVLIAGGGIGLAVWSLMNNGSGFMLILASLLALPSVPILMTLADRWSFLATTKGHEKAHLANIDADNQALRNCATISVTLLALLAIIEVATRL